jgi:hypothetical protein
VKSGNVPVHKAPGAFLKARSAMKDNNAKRDRLNHQMAQQAGAGPVAAGSGNAPGPAGTE